MRTHKERVELELDVPDGFRFTGEVRSPRLGEYYWSTNWNSPAHVGVDDSEGKASFLILEKVEPITVKVDPSLIPDGFEATGEFRCVTEGDLYLKAGYEREVDCWSYSRSGSKGAYLILRRRGE